MHIIIVGAGEVGLHLAEKLSSQFDHDISVIEQSTARCQELSDRLDVRVINANGTSLITLEEANVALCDLFLALTSDQNTNMVAASLAKSLGAKKTIARVHGSLQREEWLYDFKTHFHLDYLFSSERLAAVELAKFIRNPDALYVEELARGQIEIQKVLVAAGSDAVGKELKDLGLPPRVILGQVRRGAQVYIPRGNFTLEANDEVLLLGGPNRLKALRPRFQPQKASDGNQSVVIFGANEYGAALASLLNDGQTDVRVFETDRRLCESLANQMPEMTILHSDATQHEALREERVGEADFFVAVTPDDEDNVMSCLQAKELGTKHCLTLIHRGDYANVVQGARERLGLLGAVSPREATGRDLLRFVTADQYHLVRKLDGGVELVEAPVREGSPLADRTVSEAEFPAGVVVVAIIHAAHGQVPAATDRLVVGDTFYALVAPFAKKALLKMIRK